MRQGNAVQVLLVAAACRGERAEPPPPIAPPADPRPNIVMLLADDLGWGDLSMHGSQEARTPHVDALAAEGVRFSFGYSVASICAPARAGLLTGRYPHRVGFEDNPPRDADPDVSLPLDVTLLPERLRAAGYRTHGYGKWHLGTEPAYHPTRRGFDTWCGYLGGQRTHVPNERADEEGIVACDGDPNIVEFDWLSTHLAERAAEDIRSSPQPFFVWLAFSAVHAPLQADPRDRAIVPPEVTGPRRELLAMVHGLDRAVGIVLDALDQEGLSDSTLVFFASDNGAGPKNHGSNAPLRGMKGTPYEGGIRVPFVVRWPGHATPGTIDFPVSFLDLTATVHAAAGLPPAPLDGIDLRPWLAGTREPPSSRTLFWKLGPSWAVRDDRHKLVSHDGRPPEMFDLTTDPNERNDLAATRPEVASRLRSEWERWAADVAAE
jgi:arylsulfatase A-like enzyme